MNIFEELIINGKIQSKAELKKYYWILAKNVHPDITNIQDADEKFIKLRNNYDEALLLLPLIKEPIKRNFSRKDARDAFQEIIARGFPIKKDIRNSNKLYAKGLNTYSCILDSVDHEKGFKFEDVEKQLYDIRGETIIQNVLFGTIKMLFYNVVSYYNEPMKFTKKSTLKIFNDIHDELKSKKYDEVILFLEWLIRDLEY
jgi:hypothetical protein